MDQDKIDNSYIESAIFALFRIDVVHLITNKASMSKNFHIQPSEIDNMPMWEYEIFIKSLNDQVKSENEEQQKEMDKYDINKYKNSSYPKTPKMPKPPSIPNMKY